MGLYEQIRDIAKTKGYSINRLEKELGFARSSINKFNKNIPSVDKLQQIADLLEVSLDCLTSNENQNTLVTCKECGLFYDSSYPADVQRHQKRHQAYKRAVEKFGEIYAEDTHCETIKAKNRNIRDDVNRPIEERLKAELVVLRCLFSRSLVSCDFNLNHVTFNHYVAMMNKNPTYTIDDQLHRLLVDKYGLEDGINSGTIYHVDAPHIHTIAAHFDGDDYTEDELEEIRAYAEFIKSRRNSKK